MEELCYLGVDELSKLIQGKEVSPVELVKAFLERTYRVDPSLNAYITLLADEAIKEAKSAESAILSGQSVGPLHGVPLGVKDNYATAGVRTTVGSKILKDWIPTKDATIVDRLKKAGMIVLGKLNLDEFSFGVTTINPHYGPTRNPWDRTRIPGGSSGGPGAALATSLVPAAVGSDTGGSVRIPAAYCGIVGIKPTYGLVSRVGIHPHSWSLDHGGPMARSVRDVAMLLQVMAGRDTEDPTTVNVPVPEYLRGPNPGIKGLRVGLATDYVVNGVKTESEIVDVFNGAVAVLEREGAVTSEVSAPFEDGMVAWFVVIAVETTAAMEKYLRMGADAVGPMVRGFLEWGTVFNALDYVKSQRMRTVCRRALARVFEEVDVLVTPTMPMIPQKIEPEALGEGEINRNAPPFTYCTGLTAPFNFTGLPAISVPCGFTKAGLPVGLQIVGKPFAEDTVLRVAEFYEAHTEWHLRRPSLD